MTRTENYTKELECETTAKYEIKNPDYLLPEWIKNLKQYFKKGPERHYYQS